MTTPDEVRIIDPENGIEYEYFDEDPDGDQMRAGDGWYFRVIGEEGWSGPWATEEEAKDEMYDDLDYKQRMNADIAVVGAGFKWFSGDNLHKTYIRKQPAGEPYFIELSADKAAIRVGESGIIKTFEFPEEGYNHIVKAAIEMAQIAGPAPQTSPEHTA